MSSARLQSQAGPVGAERRDVLQLAWPAILEMMLHTCVWVVDTAMVGRLGAAALSAVGLGGQIYYTLSAAFGAVAVGATALVARRIGASEERTAGMVAARAVGFSALLGMLLSPAVFAAAGVPYRLTRMGPDVCRPGVAYLRIVSLATVPLLAGMTARAVLQATGDTRTPLKIVAVANAANILGDYVLIFGKWGFPALGVVGAAVASMAAMAGGGVVSVACLLRPACRARIRLRDMLGADIPVLRQLGRLSAPSALETALMDGARTVGSLVIARLGAVSLAAHGVAVATESLSFMPGYGFAVAAAVVAGQNLGVGRPDLAEKGVRRAAELTVGMMGLMGLVFIACPQFLIRAFTPEAAVVGLGARCLRVAGFVQIPMGLATVLAGSLRGVGDTRSPMRVAALAAWLIRVPLTFVAVGLLGMSVVAAWVVMAIEWVVKALLLLRLFRKGSWRSVEL